MMGEHTVQFLHQYILPMDEIQDEIFSASY